MKAIYAFEDEHTGKDYIVISKIREVQTALGSIVVTFDNGDKKSFSVTDLKSSLEHLLNSIEAYFSNA